MRISKPDMAKIESALKEANFRARVRTLDTQEVVEVIEEAERAGFAATARERFPGSYVGVPYQTQCLALRYGDRIAVTIQRCAKSIQCKSPFGQSWQRARDRAAWTVEDTSMVRDFFGLVEDDDQWIIIKIR